MGRVSGKVAIVTGAARGMGAAHARRLVEEGAQVMLTDILDEEGEEMARMIGAGALYRHHDVTSEAEWKYVVDETEAAFGPVSVLVNNAGICLFSAIENTELADYQRVIDVNQTSVFLGMKSVLPSMKRAGGGSMINISSAGGLIGVPNVVGYVASKFAVRGMTKTAAIEFAAHNIRVNSIPPGLIRTPMAAVEETPETAAAHKAGGTGTSRLGEPDEIASVVLMLASDEARFATGAEFVIDGGASCQ